MIVRVFASGPGDLGSIPGRVLPKTQKWFLEPPCLTQHYKVQTKSRWSNLLHLGVVVFEKGAFGNGQTTYLYIPILV